MSKVTKDAPPFLIIHGINDQTVPFEQSEELYDCLLYTSPAKYVPAAAVIRMVQALSGFTGCKGSAGGRLSLM